MTEGMRNIYDNYDFSQGFEPVFSNLHVISHSPREFFITFGVMHPPSQKPKAVAQVILTKEHLMELILNLQAQLKQFNEEGGHGKERGL